MEKYVIKAESVVLHKNIGIKKQEMKNPIWPKTGAAAIIKIFHEGFPVRLTGKVYLRFVVPFSSIYLKNIHSPLSNLALRRKIKRKWQPS